VVQKMGHRVGRSPMYLRGSLWRKMFQFPQTLIGITVTCILGLLEILIWKLSFLLCSCSSFQALYYYFVLIELVCGFGNGRNVFLFVCLDKKNEWIKFWEVVMMKVLLAWAATTLLRTVLVYFHGLSFRWRMCQNANLRLFSRLGFC